MRTTTDGLTRLALGAAGGFAGTLAIQAAMAATRKWLPAASPPLRRDPGDFMVEKAEGALPDAVRRRIPDAAEAGAKSALALGYGLAFGALYAAVRPRGGNPLLDGVALGLVTWAAGYLGWLPAAGLTPPPWRQTPAQAAGPAAQHVVYGVAAVAAYDWLAGRA